MSEKDELNQIDQPRSMIHNLWTQLTPLILDSSLTILMNQPYQIGLE